MKHANAILLATMLLASCNFAQYSEKFGRVIHTSGEPARKPNSTIELSSEEHIRLSRRAFSSGDYSESEAHAKLAMKKDVYSKEARRILEDIAMLDPYYREAHKHIQVR